MFLGSWSLSGGYLLVSSLNDETNLILFYEI
jgi:hypothetical protein